MNAKSKPLEGIRIIETGCSEASGVAALLMADFGAEVIRIDSPLDDAVRDAEDAVTFGRPAEGIRLCDRGKKRVYLDLSSYCQNKLFSMLLSTCDLIIDGYAPGTLASYGFSEEKIAEIAPQTGYISVTAFGTSGPYADRLWSEGTVQAESGFISTTGPEGGDPVRSGGDIGSFLSGLITCIAGLMALFEREAACARGERPGKARRIDISMMDSIIFGLENQFSLYLKSGIVPKPKGNRYALSAPVGNFRCSDGKEIMISVATEAQWKSFSEALGHPEWVEQPEFYNVSRRIANNAVLTQEVQKAFSAYSREELMEILQERGCIYGCINDFGAVADHVQVCARETFMKVWKSRTESFIAPGNPLLVDGIRMQGDLISLPGQQTHEVIGAL